ncbi:MAG: hypothetical protein AAGU75_02430 [Bacillota bacterium]
MFAVLKQDNSIGDFEKRGLPLTELVHEDFRHLYVEIPDDSTLKVGDIWHPDTATWEIVETQPVPVVIEPYQPSNAEVAQMISDLQADLIIAGVI